MRRMKPAAASRLLIYAQLRQSRAANSPIILRRPAERCFAVGAGERNLPPMPKRRADADGRRFFDEFASVRVSRLRASGMIHPAKRQALIPLGDKQRLVGTAPLPERWGLQLFPAAQARGRPLSDRRRAATGILREPKPPSYRWLGGGPGKGDPRHRPSFLRHSRK